MIGIGGDVFCLFYDAKEKLIKGLNASGRSSGNITLELMTSKGFNSENPQPNNHGVNVTVPGAAAGWIDCVEKFGSKILSLKVRIIILNREKE